MLEKFFSVEYAQRAELFEGLSIWKYKEYREIQGTYPVIFLSFANVKENTYEQARESICRIIQELYNKNIFLLHKALQNYFILIPSISISEVTDNGTNK